jgi:CheY-like chemotaxis protein
MDELSYCAVPHTARILLVDDNRSGLMARRAVLEELGYLTDGAENGTVALDLAAGQRYDLVVTDFRMPDMDGVELIARLRATNPELPIILLSGFVDAIGLNEKTTGANVVLMKSANEVMHLVRSAGRLLKTQRKPVRSERPRVRMRKKAVGS